MEYTRVNNMLRVLSYTEEATAIAEQLALKTSLTTAEPTRLKSVSTAARSQQVVPIPTGKEVSPKTLTQNLSMNRISPILTQAANQIPIAVMTLQMMKCLSILQLEVVTPLPPPLPTTLLSVLLSTKKVDESRWTSY